MTTPDDDLLYDLLDRWEEAHDRGTPLDPAELCRERPELVPELARRIRHRLRVKPLEPGAPGGGPPADLLNGRYRIERRIGGGTEAMSGSLTTPSSNETWPSSSRRATATTSSRNRG